MRIISRRLRKDLRAHCLPFQQVTPTVSIGETLCFIAWNTLFQGMKHIVSTVETSRETTGRISPSYKRMHFDNIPSVDEADVLQTVPP